MVQVAQRPSQGPSGGRRAQQPPSKQPRPQLRQSSSQQALSQQQAIGPSIANTTSHPQPPDSSRASGQPPSQPQPQLQPPSLQQAQPPADSGANAGGPKISACERCRRRKTRCDAQLPACGTCVKAGVECVEYDAYNRTRTNRSYLHYLERKLEALTSANSAGTGAAAEAAATVVPGAVAGASSLSSRAATQRPTASTATAPRQASLSPANATARASQPSRSDSANEPSSTLSNAPLLQQQHNHTIDRHDGLPAVVGGCALPGSDRSRGRPRSRSASSSWPSSPRSSPDPSRTQYAKRRRRQGPGDAAIHLPHNPLRFPFSSAAAVDVASQLARSQSPSRPRARRRGSHGERESLSISDRDRDDADDHDADGNAQASGRNSGGNARNSDESDDGDVEGSDESDELEQATDDEGRGTLPATLGDTHALPCLVNAPPNKQHGASMNEQMAVHLDELLASQPRNAEHTFIAAELHALHDLREAVRRQMRALAVTSVDSYRSGGRAGGAGHGRSLVNVSNWDRQLVDRLLKRYFTYMASCFPITHEVVVSFQVDRICSELTGVASHKPDASIADHFQVMMMLAISLASLSRSHRNSSDVGRLAHDLFQAAREPFDAVLAQPGIARLQCVLLTLQYSLLVPKSSNITHLSGTAMQFAIELNLHLESTMQRVGTDELSADVLRRMFWTCYCIDRALSIITGGPTTLGDEWITTRPPSIVEDTAITTEGILHSGHVCQLKIAMRQHIRLRRLQSKIQNRLYTPQIVASSPLSSSNTAGSEPEETSASMERWSWRMYERLQSWRCRATLPTPFMTKEWINLQFHFTTTLLFRPSPKRPLPGLDCLHVTLHSASETLRIYKTLHRNVAINFSWMATHNLFMAGLVYLNSLRGLHKHREICPSMSFVDSILQVQACASVLEALALSEGRSGRRARDAFERVSTLIIRQLETGMLTVPEHGPNFRNGSAGAGGPSSSSSRGGPSFVASPSGSNGDANFGSTVGPATPGEGHSGIGNGQAQPPTSSHMFSQRSQLSDCRWALMASVGCTRTLLPGEGSQGDHQAHHADGSAASSKSSDVVNADFRHFYAHDTDAASAIPNRFANLSPHLYGMASSTSVFPRHKQRANFDYLYSRRQSLASEGLTGAGGDDRSASAGDGGRTGMAGAPLYGASASVDPQESGFGSGPGNTMTTLQSNAGQSALTPMGMGKGKSSSNLPERSSARLPDSAQDFRASLPLGSSERQSLRQQHHHDQLPSPFRHYAQPPLQMSSQQQPLRLAPVSAPAPAFHQHALAPTASIGLSSLTGAGQGSDSSCHHDGIGTGGNGGVGDAFGEPPGPSPCASLWSGSGALPVASGPRFEGTGGGVYLSRFSGGIDGVPMSPSVGGIGTGAGGVSGLGCNTGAVVGAGLMPVHSPLSDVAGSESLNFGNLASENAMLQILGAYVTPTGAFASGGGEQDGLGNGNSNAPGGD